MTKQERRAHQMAMAEMVSRYRESGKSQSRFCKGEGVKPHVLSYWVCKASRGNDMTVPGVAPEAAATLPFIEITQQPAAQEAGVAKVVSGRVELVLPSGALIRTFGDVSETTLSAVIAAAQVTS